MIGFVPCVSPWSYIGVDFIFVNDWVVIFEWAHMRDYSIKLGKTLDKSPAAATYIWFPWVYFDRLELKYPGNSPYHYARDNRTIFGLFGLPRVGGGGSNAR